MPSGAPSGTPPVVCAGTTGREPAEPPLPLWVVSQTPRRALGPFLSLPPLLTTGLITCSSSGLLLALGVAPCQPRVPGGKPAPGFPAPGPPQRQLSRGLGAALPGRGSQDSGTCGKVPWLTGDREIQMEEGGEVPSWPRSLGRNRKEASMGPSVKVHTARDHGPVYVSKNLFYRNVLRVAQRCIMRIILIATLEY